MFAIKFLYWSSGSTTSIRRESRVSRLRDSRLYLSESVLSVIDFESSVFASIPLKRKSAKIRVGLESRLETVMNVSGVL